MTLIATVVVFTTFGISVYESEQIQQQFLEKEKILVEAELSQMLVTYDEMTKTSDLLSQQLGVAKKSTSYALEKLRLLKSDFSVFTQFKSEFLELRSRKNYLLNTIDSITTQNENLVKDKLIAEQALTEQVEINNSLSNINASLILKLKKGALLTANSFQAKVYKSGTNADETTRASQASRIGVCFTIAENTLTEKGLMEIYIQVLNPLNNVIADKGIVTFDESLLLYSDKQFINYDNEAIDFCTSIIAKPNDKPFAKGIYYVSVFHEDRKLGGTQVVLN